MGPGGTDGTDGTVDRMWEGMMGMSDEMRMDYRVKNEELLAAAGVTPEMAAAHAADVALAKEAAEEVLPGPLREAFRSQAAEAAGLVLRPVVASDHVILRELDSPLLHSVMGKEVREATEEEVWEAILLFTLPVREARGLLAKGRPVYREAAAERIGDRFHAVTVVELAKRVVQHYVESWSTHLGYKGKEPGNF